MNQDKNIAPAATEAEKITDRKAELVTYFCKECQKLGVTLGELKEIQNAIMRFYDQNARP